MWLSFSPSRPVALPFLLLFASRLEAQRSYTLRMGTVPQDRVLSGVRDGAQEKARLLTVRMFREQVEHLAQ